MPVQKIVKTDDAAVDLRRLIAGVRTLHEWKAPDQTQAKAEAEGLAAARLRKYHKTA